MVRVVAVVATFFGGVGIALYALGWVAMPAGEIDGRRRGACARRGSVEVAVGRLPPEPAARSARSASRSPLVWPLVLCQPAARCSGASRPPRSPSRAGAEPEPEEVVRERAAIASRTGVGVALVVDGGARLPPGHGRAQRRPRRGARRAGGGGGARRDLRPVDPAPGALAGRGAARADPLAGARRGGRPPARLRAPDAGDGAAPRRRPARGGRARPPPGARAAVVALGAAGVRARREPAGLRAAGRGRGGRVRRTA